MSCLLLVLAAVLVHIGAGQNIECAAAFSKDSDTVDISALQPCIDNAASLSSPLVLDGTRRYSGIQLQALDFSFTSVTLVLLTPGARITISSANITGVRLASPSTVPLRLLATTVPLAAALSLSNVLLETDCSTLAVYQQWVRFARPANVSLAANGDLLISSYWLQPGSVWSDCRLTCRRPSARTEVVAVPAAAGSASGATLATATVVDVSMDLELYNALALAASAYDPALPLVLAVRRSMALCSRLWAGQGLVLARNATLLGACGAAGGDSCGTSAGCGSGGGNSSSSGGGGGGGGGNGLGKAIIDLQDMVHVVHLSDGVVLTARRLAFANAGMVFGYAPVPFTGLGLVAPFLWFFDFQRTLLPKPPNQLQLYDCDIISYPQDIEHLNLWAIFLMSTVGPLAAAAAPYRVGVNELLADATEAALTFAVLDAYGMTYVNVSLPSNVAANFSLTARTSPVALYKLGLPLNTTIVPIWTQSDLQGSLAGVQRLTGCSPFSNVTVYFQLFANLSLDGTKWPQGGYNVSCNITFSGVPNRVGGTWLNFNLLPKFLSLTSRARGVLRSLTLLNMPSQQRTYDLRDLAQMTMPLWPVGRPAGSPPYLTLYDCTLVLPYEELRSLAATLGSPEGRLPSSALNASIVAVDYAPMTAHRLLLNSFEGLNMTALNTQVTDTAVAAPFAPLLGNNVYGTASLTAGSPPPPATGSLPSMPAAGGGLSSAATVIAVAIAVPLGVVILAAAAAGIVALRRRRSAAAGRAAAYKWTGDGGVGGADAAAAAAADSAEKGSGRPPGGSGGTSPMSDHSGDVMAHGGGGSVKDSSAAKISHAESADVTAPAPSLHVELHQLILDFAREIEDKHLTIHDALGSGGFATVYRGTWRGIDVAVKVIEFQDRSVGDERLQARAMTEAAIAANIQHANVVTTYSYDIRPALPHDAEYDAPSGSALLGLGPAVGPGGGGAGGGAGGSRRQSVSSEQSGAGCRAWKLYLIQEFCEVGSLRMALENRMLQTADGQPNMSMILRLALDVVRGLQHLHKKNIVHGDLTPGNILLKADLSRPGRYTGKLADFGLSVKMNPTQTSVDNNRTGTPFYASPEVRTHGNLTKASDLYAFGVVLWEMWHGRPCYQRVRGVKHYVHAQGYPSFPPHCPAAYADLASRCLRRALEERPALDEVHDTLRALRELCSCASGPGSATASDAGSASCAADEWPFAMPAMFDGLPYAVGGVGVGGGTFGPGTPAGSVGGGAAHAGPAGGFGVGAGSSSSSRSVPPGMAAVAAAPAGMGPGVALPAGLGGSPLGPVGMGGSMAPARIRGAPAKAGSWAATMAQAQIAAAAAAHRPAASANGSAAGSRRPILLAQPAHAPPTPTATPAAAAQVRPTEAAPPQRRHQAQPEPQPGEAQPQLLNPAGAHVPLQEDEAPQASAAAAAAPPPPPPPAQLQQPQPSQPQAPLLQQEPAQHHRTSQVSVGKPEPFYTPPGSLG